MITIKIYNYTCCIYVLPSVHIIYADVLCLAQPLKLCVQYVYLRHTLCSTKIPDRSAKSTSVLIELGNSTFLHIIIMMMSIKTVVQKKK